MLQLKPGGAKTELSYFKKVNAAPPFLSRGSVSGLLLWAPSSQC